MSAENRKRTLLIVDDESSVCRALSRMLTKKVDETIYATSALEAEIILESHEITHLICDHWFGAGQTLGVDLAAKWRKQYDSIERVVLLTGTDTSMLETPPEVDYILTKAVDAVDLVESLGLS